MAETTKSKPMSKSDLFAAVADKAANGLSRRQVQEVVEALAVIGYGELNRAGVFVLPGFAKFVLVKKPVRPEHEGINPFTKEKQTFAAKPASTDVRARPVKAMKDAVG